MASIIATASGKGGVGKTLLTASMGIALARQGKKVLLIDGDMGLRNMDLILGLEMTASIISATSPKAAASWKTPFFRS